MKVKSGVLGSHLGVGLLKISALVALVLGVTLALLLAPGSVKADGPYDFLIPIVLEEGRVSVKVVEHPGVEGLQPRVLRQVQGTQTSATLVSNLGQNQFGQDSLSNDLALAFTTGSHSAGYTLTGVKVSMQKFAGMQPAYQATINTNTSGRPGNQVGALDTPSPSQTVGFANQDFTASGGSIDLEANTTYWFFIDSSSSTSNINVSSTNSDNEDSGAADGWSIANKGLLRNHSATSWFSTSPLRLAVIGFAKTGPALVSAEVNGTTLVLNFDKDLDTTSRTAARQFGIKFGGGGALQRATAISISERQVTLTVPEVRVDQVVTVSYTVPTSNPLKGSNGVAVAAVSDQPVTVNTGPAFGRLPESGKVRSAIYLRYTNENGEDEVVEHRLASADRETLLDYFEDECGRTGEGAKWGGNNQNCAFHKLYVRQSYCANEDWRDRNPQVHLDQLCPTDRTW